MAWSRSRYNTFQVSVPLLRIPPWKVAQNVYWEMQVCCWRTKLNSPLSRLFNRTTTVEAEAVEAVKAKLSDGKTQVVDALRRDGWAPERHEGFCSFLVFLFLFPLYYLIFLKYYISMIYILRITLYLFLWFVTRSNISFWLP